MAPAAGTVDLYSRFYNNRRFAASDSFLTDNLRKDSNGGGLLIQDQDKLAAHIENLDGKAITELFNQTLEQYLENNEDYGWIYNFANTFVETVRYTLIAKSIIDLEAYPSNEEIIGMIDNSHNVEILKERIAAYITSVVKMITEFRANSFSHPIRIAIEYVEQNYSRQITLQDVADIVSLSTNYFSTLFKNQTGMTFLDYLTKIRMEHAKTKLRKSLMNVSEIAYSIGYTDEKYFSKLFSKIIGVKPTEYRKFHT
jgi:two-component system response regulator YesN